MGKPHWRRDRTYSPKHRQSAPKAPLPLCLSKDLKWEQDKTENSGFLSRFAQPLVSTQPWVSTCSWPLTTGIVLHLKTLPVSYHSPLCPCSLTGISPFVGENDRTTLMNIRNYNVAFEETTFLSLSREARGFLIKVLVQDRL